MGIQRSSSVDSDASETSFPEEIELSDDVLAEIITRLPVEAVARSRCVSKGWRDTVADEYLRRRLPMHMSMICFPEDDGGGDASRPLYACSSGEGSRRLEGRHLGDFFPMHDTSVICDGCNGLLLCRSLGAAPGMYVVCPVTRRWVALPRPAKVARLSMLAFDPSSSPHYHVISFNGWRESGAVVEVFSSETWEWTVRDPEFGVPAASLSLSMHYHDGAAYILAYDPDCIVRMDVAAGGLACSIIDLPEPVDGDGRVGHSGGHLHYVRSDGKLLKVWSLEEDHRHPARRWRLKHTARVDYLVEGGGEVRFLAMHPENDAVVYMWSPWKVVEYDLGRMVAADAAWEFDKGARNRVVKTWLVPSSCYLSDCLPDGRLLQH